MKKISTILIIFSIFSITLIAKDFDFRKAKWGMDTNQVIRKEGIAISRTLNGKFYTLAFNKKVAGLEALTEYKFFDNKLGKGQYTFKVKHTNNNDYIYDFQKFWKILIKKYGESKEKTAQVWENTTYKKNKDKYGLAVGMGHLSYVSNWENKNTKIHLKLKGENLKFKLTLSYTSKIYEKSVEKMTEDKDSEGL